MYPHERSLVNRLTDKPFALVGVNSDDDVTTAKTAVLTERLTWRSFYDGGTDGPIATAWAIRGWPSVFVLDAKGVVRYTDVRGKELDRAVEVLLTEMGAGP